jgi:hypothetical protein
MLSKKCDVCCIPVAGIPIRESYSGQIYRIIFNLSTALQKFIWKWFLFRCYKTR